MLEKFFRYPRISRNLVSVSWSALAAIAFGLSVAAGSVHAHEEPSLVVANAGETPAAAPAKAPAAGITLLLKSVTNGDGSPLVYPGGQAEVTVRMVDFPPGSHIVTHRHPIPLFAYMVEGEVTIEVEGEAPHRYKAGDAFMETTKWHRGYNDTNKPARLLAVYMGAVDVPLSIPQPK